MQLTPYTSSGASASSSTTKPRTFIKDPYQLGKFTLVAKAKEMGAWWAKEDPSCLAMANQWYVPEGWNGMDDLDEFRNVFGLM